MAISKIQILDNIYDFTVPSLEEKIGDLTRQLDIIKAKCYYNDKERVIPMNR